MKEQFFHRFLRRFLLAAAVLLLAVAVLVILFDPFYHFHGPLFGLKAVVTKSEYQCIGTIRNFSYDSVLCGSSTAENYNNRWFNELFGAKTVKAIKSSGNAADLCYYLQEAFDGHEVKNVFYSLDLFSLEGDPQKNFLDDTMPLYLYDKNPFNDVKYLWNKDVLFEDIPYLLAMNLAGDYDEGASYNWWEYKTFSAKEALSHYERAETVESEIPKEQYEARLEGNLDLLEEMVAAHPETEFSFLLPPYSLLWWDNAYRNGQAGEYLYARRRIFERLLPYANARIFDFQAKEEVVLNLDNYMDPIHFSQEINHWMAVEAASSDSAFLVKKENAEGKITKMEELFFRIVSEEADRLFESKNS